MICDICGYESDWSTVFRCVDGLYRCKVCHSRAVHGRCIPQSAVGIYNCDNVRQYIDAYDRWEKDALELFDDGIG